MQTGQVTSSEARRLSAPGGLNIADTGPAEEFDDIAKLAAQVCDAPLSLITLVDENRQWLRSGYGISGEETPGYISFCTHLIDQPGIFIVPDTMLDARFVDHPQVMGKPFIRFYAGVPLLSDQGLALGTLCVLDYQPRNLNNKQIFGLEVLARSVQTMLQLPEKVKLNKKAEEEIIAFDTRFRHALEQIGDNVWEHDFTTEISTFSKAENNLIGYVENGFIANTSLWWQSIHPDDHFLLQENDRKWRAGEIDSHCLEYRMRLKDGSVKWVLDRGVVIEKSSNGLPLKLIGTHTDITSLKKNEALLKESRQRWKFALEGSGDGVWDWDLITGKVYYSKRWKEMLGYEKNEIGDDLQAWEVLIHPDDRANVHNELQIHFSTAMPFYQSEHRLLCKDGTYKWILDRGMVVARDENNQPLRVIGTHTDISQIKYTELALEQRLKQFKSLSDNIPGVIYEYEFRKDGSEGFKYISPAIRQLFGIGAEDYYDYHRFIHPDDIALIETKNKISVETLEPIYCEARLVVPDRGIIWFSLSSSFSYFTENGSKVFTGFMLDITERKHSEDLLKIKEEKYRSIIANMNLGLLEVDTEETILFANQSFCDMSGYEYDELIDRKTHEIFVTKENIGLIKSKSEARKEAISDAYELAVRNKRGQLRWWLISGAPRYDDTGALVGSIGIHLDITDQKKLEIDLIEAREQAEQSTRSKEVFLANMSHEIRTPMNAIVGMSNQLAKTNLDSAQKFYLDTINAASENLLFIINDILDLSKIEAGKLQLEKIGFKPKDMVNRAILVLSHKAEEKGLIVTNAGFDTAISPILIGDPFRLNQVLLNLFNNAIKFTEKGSVDISCTLLKDGPVSQTIRIAVKDTGIGMEALFVKNLFEKFSQEDASVTRQYGGTGLGMSISKDLVELMGGEIKVESKKGVGTTISFVIEFEKGTQENLPVKQTFTLDANMLSGKKILVVDDNKMNRLVAATILKNYGAAIVEAVNGQESIDALKDDNSIDLVLMDIQMPVMDGMEATGIIRESISKTLPVIALTANAIKGDNDKCIEAGMNGYLSKPFKEKDLLNIVAFWLGHHKKQQPADAPGVSFANTKLYDLSGIQQLGRGSEGFVEKMIRVFTTQTPALVTEMEKKFHHGNYTAMAAIAGKIRTAVESLCITVLKEPIREIERAGRAGTAGSEMPALLGTIKAVINDVVAGLKKEFP